jgi:hypothetical protein
MHVVTSLPYELFKNDSQSVGIDVGELKENEGLGSLFNV